MTAVRFYIVNLHIVPYEISSSEDNNTTNND
jgi:hypothetical protein